MKVFSRDGAFGFMFAICLSLFLLFSVTSATLFSVWALSGDRHITTLVSLVFTVTQIVPVFANVSTRVAYGPKNNYRLLSIHERAIARQRLRQYAWQATALIAFGVVVFCIGKEAPVGLSLLALVARMCIGFAALMTGTFIGYRSLLWTTELKPRGSP